MVLRRRPRAGSCPILDEWPRLVCATGLPSVLLCFVLEQRGFVVDDSLACSVA